MLELLLGEARQELGRFHLAKECLELKESYARYRQTLKIIRHIRDLIPDSEREQKREVEKVIEKRIAELEMEAINPPEAYRVTGEKDWRNARHD